MSIGILCPFLKWIILFCFGLGFFGYWVLWVSYILNINLLLFDGLQLFSPIPQIAFSFLNDPFYCAEIF